MELNKNRLPVKYLVGVWKTLPGYPTKEDVLYELANYIQRKVKGGEFSEQTFNGIWCDQSGVANWKNTQIEKHLNSMISGGTFEKTKDSGDKIWYRIKDTALW